ncbi:MAG: phosphatidate cytidylyltransferase [Sphingomonadaceae bacterium]|jgi:phosphatidate cytidylyltransferase|uniref:phosphatidate cytidylyltransferase n=1 Tax=Sphingorhabdus sp. TaxID=1902408 RepID=UPI0039BD16FE|nr:phosphatidate cytidylyltransferase [Sphingomonadaceae bacterium]
MTDKIVPLLKPRSDLGVRTLSSVAMMSVAIGAIWLGGYAFMALIVLVGLGVYWEFAKLALAFARNMPARFIWLAGGLLYVGLACFTLLLFSAPFFGMTPTIMLIAGVIGTDVGAYFAGRTLSGPKIAPRISPSKTWSGLLGGMVGAGLMMIAIQAAIYAFRGGNAGDGDVYLTYGWQRLALTGAALAVVAQIGDFFESWMKRRAGVKDSGRLIPGHGGLLDRTDGLIAVAFVAGLITVSQSAMGS